MDYVISKEVADDQLNAMEEEFGAVSEEVKPVLLDAIRRGLIDFDQDGATVTYLLQKPVRIDGKEENLESITLHEPCYSEIDRINSTMKVKADSNANFEVDGTMTNRQVARIIIVLGGISTSTMDKIKRRDYAVLEALSDFFG